MDPEDGKKRAPPARGGVLCLAALVAFAVIAAVGLGVGLGVGLKPDNATELAACPAGLSAPTGALPRDSVLFANLSPAELNATRAFLLAQVPLNLTDYAEVVDADSMAMYANPVNSHAP